MVMLIMRSEGRMRDKVLYPCSGRERVRVKLYNNHVFVVCCSGAMLIFACFFQQKPRRRFRPIPCRDAAKICDTYTCCLLPLPLFLRYTQKYIYSPPLLALFFSRHKATGMIDVVSRRCQYPQCVRRPLYAMAGQRAMFCRTHKAPEHTDVVSRRCSYEVSVVCASATLHTRYE